KPADNNKEKFFYTQGGNQIYIDDTDRAAKIEITNVNKTDTAITLLFDGSSPKVTIKTSGDIEVNADKNIDIKATQKLTLQGQDVEIKATTSLLCDGGQKSTVKGMEIKVDAGTNATVNANAQAKISSKLTEVSASSVMTVKGKLVKIN
ncbi:MAG: hypothetical protein C4308_09580, partial [Chitinophagaceae bacterium]